MTDLIHFLARVKETLDGHKDEYKSEITDIKELIKSVTELAVRVQAQEARNKVLAENRFAQMRKEVSNAKRNTQAASTYYNSMNKLNFEPHLMDQKNKKRLYSGVKFKTESPI